ncbi:MAG: PKD domain-containing protein [Pseudomonadales bacterium]
MTEHRDDAEPAWLSDRFERFDWDFGDGEGGLGQLISHRYGAAGTYPVSLTVSNSAGLSASRQATVKVLPGVATVSMSGFVEIASSNNVDSDLNDPDSIVIPNNRLADAQPIATPTQLGGYLTVPRGGASGPLFAAGDAIDYFRFDAAGGEVIDLNIADKDALDIDLYLLTLDGVEVDASINLGSREQVVVPEPGAYLLSVEIFDGTGGSNYILQLSTQALGASLDPTLRRSSDDFLPGELLFLPKAAAPPPQLGSWRCSPKVSLRTSEDRSGALSCLRRVRLARSPAPPPSALPGPARRRALCSAPPKPCSAPGP